MILEQALLEVIAGRESDYEAALVDALPIIRAAEGCISAEVTRCVEEPNTYLLLVQWETLEDHTVGFRESAGFAQWRALLWEFYDPKPVVRHFEIR